MSDAPEWWLHPRCNAEVERLTAVAVTATTERNAAIFECERLTRELEEARAERDAAQRECTILRNDGQLSMGCFQMIRETLAALDQTGYDGNQTPPMMLNDWATVIIARDRATLAQRDEQVKALREQLIDASRTCGAALAWLGSEFPNAEGGLDRFGGAIPARDDLRQLEVDLRAVEHYARPLLAATAPESIMPLPADAKSVSNDRDASDQHAPPVMSRSVQRRIAAQKGEPPPTFDGPDVPPADTT